MAEGDINQAVELFKSRDLRKKKWSLDIASEMGTPEAAALIIKALQDQSWALREYAIAKAVQLGPMMVPPLCRLLRSGVWYSRAAAVQALEKIGDIKALPRLLPLAEDSNQTVARATKTAMRHLASQAGPEGLSAIWAEMETGQRKYWASMFPEYAPIEDQHLAEISDNGPSQDDPQILQQIRQTIKSCSQRQWEGEDAET